MQTFAHLTGAVNPRGDFHAHGIGRTFDAARASAVSELHRVDETQPPEPGEADHGTTPEQRVTGIVAGLAWAEVAEAIVVYTDLGISQGMNAAIDHYRLAGRTVEFRTLPGWDGA